jgi:hypothetical protein
MGRSGLQFCDACAGSIPAAGGVRLPNGAVYCAGCSAKMLAKELAGGKVPPDFAEKPPKVRLPAWNLVTVCVTILLLMLALGTIILLSDRVERLSHDLREVSRNLLLVQQQMEAQTRMSTEIRDAALGVLGRRPGDLDAPNDRRLIADLLKAFQGSVRDQRHLADDLLDDLEGARRSDRLPATRPRIEP